MMWIVAWSEGDVEKDLTDHWLVANDYDEAKEKYDEAYENGASILVLAPMFDSSDYDYMPDFVKAKVMEADKMNQIKRM